MAAKMVQIKKDVETLLKQIENQEQEAIRHERAAHYHRKQIDQFKRDLQTKQRLLDHSYIVATHKVMIVGSPPAPYKYPTKATYEKVMCMTPPPLKKMKPVPVKSVASQASGDHGKRVALSKMNSNRPTPQPSTGEGNQRKVKPSWMSQNTFEKSKGIPKVGAQCDVTCPGCDKKFGAKAIGKSKTGRLYCIEYHVHCIEECEDYKSLGAIKECQICDLKFLNILSFDYHKLKKHPESMIGTQQH